MGRNGHQVIYNDDGDDNGNNNTNHNNNNNDNNNTDALNLKIFMIVWITAEWCTLNPGSREIFNKADMATLG